MGHYLNWKYSICTVLIGQRSDLCASIVFNLTKQHSLNQQDLLSFQGKKDSCIMTMSFGNATHYTPQGKACKETLA